MKFFSYLLVAVVAAVCGVAVTLYFANKAAKDIPTALTTLHLKQDAAATTDRFQRQLADLVSRQKAFCDAVAADRHFATALLVDQDTTAPEVTGIAQAYRMALGLNDLTLADGDGRILSSAPTQARAGEILTERPVPQGPRLTRSPQGDLLVELTTTFAISGIPFVVAASIILDETFVENLSPSSETRLVVRLENRMYGAPEIKTISMPDSTGHIYINNHPWLCESLTLPIATDLPIKAWVVVPSPQIFGIQSIIKEIMYP